MKVLYNPTDYNYPIIFEDSWGGVVHLNREEIANDEKWEIFIKTLECVKKNFEKIERWKENGK